jgi:hypothetical protein
MRTLCGVRATVARWSSAMSVSMHAMSVPVFVRALRNLRNVLQIGEKFASEKGITPEVLLQSRLIADMLPLVRHVQIVTDMAKNGCARLTATEPLPRVLPPARLA